MKHLVFFLLVFAVFSIACAWLSLNSNEDEFCTEDDSAYKMIVENHETWMDYFSANPSESLYIRNPESLRIHFEQSSLIVVERESWPTHPYGVRGYVYVTNDELPILAGVDELEYLSNSVYCYQR